MCTRTTCGSTCRDREPRERGRALRCVRRPPRRAPDVFEAPGSDAWAGAAVLAERETARRPVRERHRADEAAPGHRAPRARVARVHPVVAEEEVVPRRDARPASALVPPP